MIFQGVQQTSRLAEVGNSELISPLEISNATEAGRVAIVISDHDGWIQ